MEVHETKIPGVLVLTPHVHTDQRGTFVKTMQRTMLEKHGLETGIAEEYHTVSTERVVRGMHFQCPPHDHVKTVYCVWGSVFDAVVDLREGSPTRNEVESFTLDGFTGTMLYIPRGCAHGFCVLGESAIVAYRVTSEYEPNADAGVRWDTCGISWPVSNPILSSRDASLPPLNEFKTPFHF